MVVDRSCKSCVAGWMSGRIGDDQETGERCKQNGISEKPGERRERVGDNKDGVRGKGPAR